MSIFNFSLFCRECQWLSKTRKCGFLLIEAIIGLFLVVLLSTSITYWHINIIHQQLYIIKRIKALNLACSLLERARAFKKIPSKLNSQDKHIRQRQTQKAQIWDKLDKQVLNSKPKDILLEDRQSVSKDTEFVIEWQIKPVIQNFYHVTINVSWPDPSQTAESKLATISLETGVFLE